MKIPGENMKSERVTFAGNIIVDSVKMLPSWPERGMLVNVSSVQRSVGGCVSNTAIDLKRLDPSIEVRAIGKIGDDEPGRFAVGTLELEKKFKRRNVCWST